MGLEVSVGSSSNLHDRLQETVNFLKTRIRLKPQVGIVLGSGLGAFARDIQVETTLPFDEIPNFAPPSVEGHQGNLVFGHIGGKAIVALQGRLHYYEGHSLDAVVFPTRVMALLGAPVMILTNSAGGLSEKMKSGDFMIIEDHINLTGANPLMGPNMKELGPRFPDMTEAYDKKLIAQMETAFKKLNISYHRGVYAGVSGPTYETPAEIRFLKMIGCSAVGMSTVPETIAANHLGLRVAALSCITNLAAGLSAHKLTHEEVTETARRVEKDFAAVLKEFISDI
jgi:purine-nucleoside phosphorylase